MGSHSEFIFLSNISRRYVISYQWIRMNSLDRFAIIWATSSILERKYDASLEGPNDSHWAVWWAACYLKGISMTPPMIWHLFMTAVGQKMTYGTDVSSIEFATHHKWHTFALLLWESEREEWTVAKKHPLWCQVITSLRWCICIVCMHFSSLWLPKQTVPGARWWWLLIPVSKHTIVLPIRNTGILTS